MGWPYIQGYPMGKAPLKGREGQIIIQNYFHMKVVSWNIRGAGRKGFLSQIRT